MLPSRILLGLGSWVLTVPCTETLILGCTHLLVINSNRMTATRCGSSLSLSSPHQCPGPWPDENADAKKHHTPAKLSWSVGGAHGKWVTVSESDGEWAKPDWYQWGRVSQTRLLSTISTEKIALRSQLVKTLERSSSVIHRSLSARVQGRGLLTAEMHIRASQTCVIFNHGDAACNQKPC